ncbi:glycosyltransferase family 61 protein [Methylobacterium haplocladii]|uniref:Glycosyltransferase 61 catalytic domain-containing protein n=1 Tax=Methylobacterium haplocladii TaxID=1176176 RepID=A0A512IT14_9HYPH|nr:glycosyltransferase 61 family protein [Methylobacterium haplocladii]GEP00779.1 hypothetical protein MHA02_31660 [Methylobacterium haplocladii]GJD83114.1 hypothetical protein HPGCJGGD_0976 [Methylobacterium haplocladii]GLS59514.1 hypothetical protein GCM10007887_21830 [Methylobacterium haplocladii]
MMLAKCPILWGQCNVVEDALRVVRHRDVFLHHWSIYDRSGRMIEDSGFFRAFPDHASVGGPLAIEPPAASSCMPGGDVFWLGLFQVHFGHFLVGTLARLWALAQHADGATRIAYVGTDDPEALFRIDYIRLCLEALGVRREQLVRVEGPFRFPSLTIAEPSFVENFSASPAYHAMMRRIGDHVLGGAAAETPPQADVWLSKALIASGNRTIVNEIELTEALARHGVATVHPERLGFAEQLRLWSRARIAMGFASSAFHTTAFRGGQQLCTLSNNLAASSNQALIDRVCGNRSLFLHVIDGLREEPGTVAGFAVAMVIADPAWMAGELARIADAFRAGRISPQAAARVPRPLWPTRSGPAAFGEDMAGQGTVKARRADGRIVRWQIGWEAVRSVNAITVRDRSGTTEPGSFSIDVSGDAVDWVTVSGSDVVEARPDGPDATLFTYRTGCPLPTRFVRIDVLPGTEFDVGEIAVFGERLEPEVGLPDTLMHSVLALRATGGPTARIVRTLSGALARIGALVLRRRAGH